MPHNDNALVAVAAQVFARHGPADDLVGKGIRRIFATPPRLAVDEAELTALRRVDPVNIASGLRPFWICL